MSIWSAWFETAPTATELKVKLKELEREQQKTRRGLEMVAEDKSQKVREAVAAEKAGKEELLQDVFREMRQMDIDSGFINRELRQMSLGKMALKAYIRRLEMLERREDQKSIETLLSRVRSSSIQTLISKAEVSDEIFMSTLEEILGEEEASSGASRVHADSGYDDWRRTISDIARAEEGNAEPAELERLRVKADRLLKGEKIKEDIKEE